MKSQILINTAEMLAHFSATKLIDLIYESVKEVTIVADEDDSAIECLYSFFQNVLRLHIEMVGRLVEDKEIDWLKEQTYHRKTGAFTA